MTAFNTKIDLTSTAKDDDNQILHQNHSIEPQFTAKHSETTNPIKDEPDEPLSEYHFEEEPQPSSNKLHRFIEALDQQVKVEPRRRSESPDLLIVDEVPAKKKRQKETPSFKSEPQTEPPQTSTHMAHYSSRQRQPISSAQDVQEIQIIERQLDPTAIPSHLIRKQRLEFVLKKHADLPIGCVLQMAYDAYEKSRAQQITLSLETLLRLANAPCFDQIVSGCYVRFHTTLPNGFVKLAYIKHSVDLGHLEELHGIRYSKCLYLIHATGSSKCEEYKSLHHITNSTEITDQEYFELKGNLDSELPVTSERKSIKESQLQAELSKQPPITTVNAMFNTPISVWKERVGSSAEFAPCFLTRSQIFNLVDAQVGIIPQLLVGCYFRGLIGRMAKIVHVSEMNISDWLKYRRQSSSIDAAELIYLSIKCFRIQHIFGFGAFAPSFTSCCLAEIGDEPLTDSHFNEWVDNLGHESTILPTLEYVDWKAQQLAPYRIVLNLKSRSFHQTPQQLQNNNSSSIISEKNVSPTMSLGVKNNAIAEPANTAVNSQFEQPDERDEKPIVVVHTRQHETSRTILHRESIETNRTFGEAAGGPIPVTSSPPQECSKGTSFFVSLPQRNTVVTRTKADKRHQMDEESESILKILKEMAPAKPGIKILRKKTHSIADNQSTTSKFASSHQPNSASTVTTTTDISSSLQRSEEVLKKPTSSLRVFMPKKRNLYYQ